MKLCKKCDSYKVLTGFYIRKTGLRKGERYEKCKECYKSRGRIYYKQNRERQLRLALIRKKRYKSVRRAYLEKIKGNKPCVDCRKIYPSWVMDFDHLEGTAKIDSISRLVVSNTANFEKIKIEIAKCELICANCHRQRTHDRMIKLKQAEIAKLVKAPL